MLPRALTRGLKRVLAPARGSAADSQLLAHSEPMASTHVTQRHHAGQPQLAEASDGEDDFAPARPVYRPSDHFDSPVAAPANEEAAKARRLAEMRAAISTATQRPGRASPAGGTSSWMPSASEVAERLKRSSSGGCSTSAAVKQAVPEPTAEPELDWRAVVNAAHAAQLRVSGEQMLTDTFMRKHTYLRISLTERCNLRCLYCMPEEGVDLAPGSELLSSDEVVRLASLFVAAGVDKIRLTGGEPTLRADLPELTARLAALPGLKALGITTNGLVLARKLPALRAAGLTHVNISLDTLRADRFEAMTRRRGHDRVLAGIDAALAQGYDPVKVNVVVMRGVNDDEIADFVELTRSAPVNVRFIEYMPFDGNVWSDTKMVRYKEMLARVEAAFPQGLERCADPKGEVAKNFRVRGFSGSVSFITSMTSAFCGDCNRLRLMADGNLKVCLFGANEVSLRDAMREGASDQDLAAVVHAAVGRKKAAHAGMFELAARPNRAMVKIGG